MLGLSRDCVRHFLDSHHLIEAPVTASGLEEVHQTGSVILKPLLEMSPWMPKPGSIIYPNFDFTKFI